MFELLSKSFTFIYRSAVTFFRSLTYSMMQSDGNSFWGDVVLDSFNMVYREEGCILDKKIYKKQILWNLYMQI